MNNFDKNLEEQEWLARRFEELLTNSVPDETRRNIAEVLIKSQAWDNFMASKYSTVKRYGGEGSESVMAFFWQLLQSCAEGCSNLN